MQNPNEPKCRSILVPLDGSDFAEHALPTALSLARRHGAALHIVRVYVPVAGVHGEYAIRYDEALDRELIKRARQYLDGVVTRLEAVGGIQSTAVLLEGSVPHTISRHAAAVGADLLVMTTQGRGPLARFWLGSVADELVRQTGIPILFVRRQPAAPDFSGEPVFQRVLIPLDGSPLAERVLEPVFALDAGIQREYTLLRVVMPVVATLNYSSTAGAYAGLRESLKQSDELDQAESKGAHEYLERLAGRWRARSYTVNAQVISNDRPAVAILDQASVQGADLIALATHGRGGLKRLILGSVTDKVLRGADTAVLVYRLGDDSVPAVP
jgi:nucleotide-binding universal stress UspA family protein